MIYPKKREKTEEAIKEAIKEALIQLLKQQSIHTINVTDIANTASINRVTIYRHFSDKWEILESIENEVLTRFIQPHQNLKLNLQKALEIGLGKEFILKPLSEFLSVFHLQLDKLQVLTSSHSNSGFSNRLLTFLIELETQSHSYTHLQIPSNIRELFSYSIMSMLLGIIEFWSDHPNMTSEELAEFIFDVRFGAIHQLTQRQQNNH